MTENSMLIRGQVLASGVRVVGKETKTAVAWADVYLGSVGIVSCETWDAAADTSPGAGNSGTFQVERIGRFFGGKQSFGGKWITEPAKVTNGAGSLPTATVGGRV